jgi:hypothetical protein
MELRMSKTLKMWVDVACEQRKARVAGKTRQALVAEVLHEFEEAGEAMRYLNSEGQIAWRATPSMLARLADAEREAIDDSEDDLP